MDRNISTPSEHNTWRSFCLVRQEERSDHLVGSYRLNRMSSHGPPVGCGDRLTPSEGGDVDSAVFTTMVKARRALSGERNL